MSTNVYAPVMYKPKLLSNFPTSLILTFWLSHQFPTNQIQSRYLWQVALDVLHFVLYHGPKTSSFIINSNCGYIVLGTFQHINQHLPLDWNFMQYKNKGSFGSSHRRRDGLHTTIHLLACCLGEFERDHERNDSLDSWDHTFSLKAHTAVHY